MKKMFVLIVVMFLLGSLLTAAAPRPPQTLHGTLRWQHANVCGVSDFVPTEAMTNVYLTGNFQPTRGLAQGCHILATGFYYQTGQCTYFNVDKYQLACVKSTP